MTKEELMAYINEHGDARKVIDVAKQIRAEGIEVTREELDKRLKPVTDNTLAEFAEKNRAAMESFEESHELEKTNTLAIIMGVLTFLGSVLMGLGYKVVLVGDRIVPSISAIGYIGIAILVVIPTIASWKLFEKAGHAGWKILIPIYNGIVLFDIIWDNGAKYFLLLIPFFNIYWAIRSMIELGNRFGKETGFKVGLVLLGSVFQVILGFDNSEYR